MKKFIAESYWFHDNYCILYLDDYLLAFNRLKGYGVTSLNHA